MYLAPIVGESTGTNRTRQNRNQGWLRKRVDVGSPETALVKASCILPPLLNTYRHKHCSPPPPTRVPYHPFHKPSTMSSSADSRMSLPSTSSPELSVSCRTSCTTSSNTDSSTLLTLHNLTRWNSSSIASNSRGGAGICEE